MLNVLLDLQKRSLVVLMWFNESRFVAVPWMEFSIVYRYTLIVRVV